MLQDQEILHSFFYKQSYLSLWCCLWSPFYTPSKHHVFSHGSCLSKTPQESLSADITLSISWHPWKQQDITGSLQAFWCASMKFKEQGSAAILNTMCPFTCLLSKTSFHWCPLQENILYVCPRKHHPTQLTFQRNYVSTSLLLQKQSMHVHMCFIHICVRVPQVYPETAEQVDHRATMWVLRMKPRSSGRTLCF